MVAFTNPYRKKGEKAPPHPVFGYSISSSRPPRGTVQIVETPEGTKYLFGSK